MSLGFEYVHPFVSQRNNTTSFYITKIHAIYCDHELGISLVFTCKRNCNVIFLLFLLLVCSGCSHFLHSFCSSCMSFFSSVWAIDQTILHTWCSGIYLNHPRQSVLTVGSMENRLWSDGSWIESFFAKFELIFLFFLAPIPWV